MSGALAGFLGDILITSPPSVSVGADYALTDSGDHKTFNNTTASKRYWDNTSVPVVQTSVDGSTWIAAIAGTTIRYVNGQVVVPTAIGGTAQCRLHSGGLYFPYASIGNTTNWDAQMTVKAQESTTHKGVGGSAWQDYVLTTGGGKINLKKWWIDETMVNSLIARTLLIASCLSSAGNRIEAYCRLDSDSVNAVKDGLIEEPIVFTFTDQVYSF